MHGTHAPTEDVLPPQDDHGSPTASKMANSPNERLTNFMEDLREIYDLSWPIVEYVWDMY